MASTISTRFIAEFSIEGAIPLELGLTPYGRRRIVGIQGGEVVGPRLNGRVLPSGADSALVRLDGVFEHDVRMVVHTVDDALIHVTYRGRWHAQGDTLDRLLRREGGLEETEYYLRTAMFFETAANQYDWLNKIVAIGVGKPRMGTVSGIQYEVFEVL